MDRIKKKRKDPQDQKCFSNQHKLVHANYKNIKINQPGCFVNSVLVIEQEKKINSSRL